MKRLLALAATASALTLATATQAATLWSFTGNSAADGPASATALIDVTAGGLTVDLTSLLADPTSVGQLLSGIRIFFDTTPATTALTSASGSELNISKSKTKGSPTVTDATDGVIGHWGTTISGGSVYLATAGTGSMGGAPFNLIIGGPGGGIPYTHANASIFGDNPHINGTGHFTLTFSGLMTAPKITGVNLAFGTSGTDYHMATCSKPVVGGPCGDDPPPPPPGIPEPATWAMMIMGFGGVGALMRRRRTVFG